MDRVALTLSTRPVESVVIETLIPGLSLDVDEFRLPRVIRVPLDRRNVFVLPLDRSLITILSAVTESIVPPYTPASAVAADKIKPTHIARPNDFAKLCMYFPKQ